MGSPRKNACTPEKWAAHLLYHRARRANPLNKEREKQRQRKYNARPEVKARRKARDALPEIKLKRRLYAQTEYAKTRAKLKYETRNAENPEVRKNRIARQRQRRTGFTPAMIETFLAHQKNRCAVCDRPFGPGVKVCADHCHQSGKPRGLLCHQCNTVEGFLNRTHLSPLAFAERLTKYLANPPAS